MATVKVKFRTSTVSGKEGVIFYQIIHDRVIRQVSTGYRLYPSEWNAKHSIVIMPNAEDWNRRNYLTSLADAVSHDMSCLKRIILRLDYMGEPYTADDVLAVYVSKNSGGRGFMDYARGLIKQLRLVGRTRTADTYATSMNSFSRFRRGVDVSLGGIDSALMLEYELWLKATGVCANTSSYYMRNLRAIYNRAVDQGLVVHFDMKCSPFKHVYTGISKTVKRAVPIGVIRQLRDMDLTLNLQADYARDIFMFSFYTRGMSFVDMAFLAKHNLKNGILSYCRRKTGQRLYVKWEKPMQDIVDKYRADSSPYLLPIIRDARRDEYRQYRAECYRVNARLKQLGKRLNLPIPLTTYVARHSWASIAKSRNISLATISEAMGHDSEKTTRIYLASLDTSVVDRANNLILSLL